MAGTKSVYSRRHAGLQGAERSQIPNGGGYAAGEVVALELPAMTQPNASLQILGPLSGLPNQESTHTILMAHKVKQAKNKRHFVRSWVGAAERRVGHPPAFWFSNETFLFAVIRMECLHSR